MNLETFKVEGMASHQAEQEVKTALSEKSGVEEARVDIQKERASVLFNPQKVELDELKNEVRAEGYEVK